MEHTRKVLLAFFDLSIVIVLAMVLYDLCMKMGHTRKQRKYDIVRTYAIVVGFFLQSC